MGSSPIPSAGTTIPTPGQPQPMQPGEWQGSASPTSVNFSSQHIQPPSALYIQTGEILSVSLNSDGGVSETITISLRMLLPKPPTPGQPDGTGFAQLPKGATVASSVTQVPPGGGGMEAGVNVTPGAYIQQIVLQVSSTTGVPTYAHLLMQEGFLLSIGVIAANCSQRGSAFVRIWLQKAAVVGTTLSAAMPLVGDYVTQYHPIGWPASRVLFPTEGPGTIYEEFISNPSAGADWVKAIPINSRVRFQSIAAVLTTSATVANRIVRFRTENLTSGILFQAAASAVITANQTILVVIAPIAIVAAIDPSTVTIALPAPLYLYGGEFVLMNTVNLQAGDQWSAIHLHSEIWVDGI